jgi:hypothetical protein
LSAQRTEKIDGNLAQFENIGGVEQEQRIKGAMLDYSSRATEWQTEGGKLRLGIFRRFDGQVCIDIQHTNRFGAPRETVWSMDAVL